MACAVHLLAASLLMTGGGVPAVQAGQVHLKFAFADDDPDYIAYVSELVDAYNAANDEVFVEFISAGYAQLKDQLPLQLMVGQGPDMAKLTDYTLMPYFLDMRPYLKDVSGFEALHGRALEALRIGSSDYTDKIPGFVASQTVNLPIVNATLFAQANEPLPAAGATLREIVDASVRVARITEVDIPFSMDRSGHRFMGPALSYGAAVEVNRRLVFPDEGARRLIADLYSWSQSGAFPRELWGAAGGSRYKSMADDFINAQAVTYFSGNWMVGPFQKKIGDNFEWLALPAPCGEAGCFTMSGGTAIVGFQHTKHPQEVTDFLEYLGSEPVQREIAERFVLIPGAEIPDLDFRVSSESAGRSMRVFVSAVDSVPPISRVLESSKGTQALYKAVVQRVGQLIVNEFTLEQALARLEKDVVRINSELDAIDAGNARNTD